MNLTFLFTHPAPAVAPTTLRLPLSGILSASQVKISKHLAYLREHALVETRRDGAWIIYSLPAKPSRELTVNMTCLQDCCRESAVFTADLRRMTKALASCAGPLADCCKPSVKPRLFLQPAKPSKREKAAV